MQATNEPSSDDIHSLELDFAKHPNTDSFVPLCEAYLRQKRYMEAMLVCKKGIKNLPNDPRGRLLLSRVYLEQGKPPKAEQELITLLEIFPDNVDALIMQAEIYKQSGRKSDAINVLQRANQVQPGRNEIKDGLKALGVAEAPPPPPQQMMMQQQMMQQGMPMQQMPPQQPGNSVDAFFGQDAPMPEVPMQGGRTITGTFPTAQQKRGNPMVLVSIVGILIVGFGLFLFFYMQHVSDVRKIDGLLREAKPLFEKNTLVGYRQSLDKYNQIIETDPKSTVVLSINAYIHYWLAGAQLVQESKPLAEKFLAEASKGKEDNHYRAAAAGWAKILASDPKGAIDLLEPQAQKYSSSLVHMVLAEAHTQLGEEAQAKDQLTKASQLAAADNATLVRTGEANLDEGKYEPAKGYFDQVLNQEAGHPGALIGRIMANLGKAQDAPEAAEKDLEKLLATPVEYLTPRWKAGQQWAKGLLDLRRGKIAEAKASFDEASKIDPNNLRNLAIRGKMLSGAGQLADAMKDYQAVLAKRPNHFPSQVGLAMAYSSLGKTAEAQAIVDQLLAKEPSNLDLQMVKAKALRAQKKPDEALATLEKVLQAKKNFVEAKIEMASITRERKDYPKAIDILKEAITVDKAKGVNYVKAVFELGRAYQDKNEADAAKTSYGEVLKKDSEFADAYFFLGKLLKGKDKKEAMQRYLSLAPSGVYSAEAEKVSKAK